MAFQRRLSDHQLIAARWEYEFTSISERALAAKYGLSRSAIHAWITKRAWTKADVLRSYEGDEGRRQFQRDVRAAIKAGDDKKIIQALQQTLALPPPGKVTKVAIPGQPDTTDVGDALEMFPDRPQSLQKASVAGSRGHRGPSTPGYRVDRFPLPPTLRKPNPVCAFPAHSRTEQAAMRTHLGTLRSELALQQIQQLERHEELLWDYHRLLEAFLNPGKFLDAGGLDPDLRAAKLAEISRQAGRRVLPTERDTLAGAIQTLSKALLATVAAKRTVAGVTPRQLHGRTPQDEGDEQAAPRDLNRLDLPSLRSIRAAMALLLGDHQRHNEPPVPPPPDQLDDPMMKRAPAPGNE
jgi:hypothetical protein